MLREAGEHRVVGGRVEGGRPRPGSTPRATLALGFDEWILVEEAVAGREIEVAVLGDDPPEASVPGEIVPGDEFYSYADKYEADDAELLAPGAAHRRAGRGGAGARGARRSRRAGCEAMARVDLFLEEAARRLAGRGFLVNEVNTIPGFTPISMYPRLWEVSGLPYPSCSTGSIDLALDAPRAPRRAAPGRQRATSDATG